MANPEQLEEQREETRLIIEELLEDGSDPDALYTIEHHLSADDLETLEKAAVEAFKLGYEVTDPEELEVEDGDIVICCDILSECALNADLIDAQVEQLMTLAETRAFFFTTAAGLSAFNYLWSFGKRSGTKPGHSTTAAGRNNGLSLLNADHRTETHRTGKRATGDGKTVAGR